MATPITYKEAASILGISNQRIRLAVHYGTLMQVPGNRYVKQVYREQVELFKGKAELSKSLLSQDERENWEAVAALAKPPAPAPMPIKQEAAPAPALTVHIGFPDRNSLEFMSERGIGVKATPTPSGELLFQSALADKDIVTLPASPLVVLILLGLLALFFLGKNQEERTAAIKKAEKEIRRIGLEEEDLFVNQKKAIARLVANPQAARELQALLEQENLLPAA